MTGPTVPNEAVDQALREYNRAIGAGLGRRAAMSRALAAVRTQTANEIEAAILAKVQDEIELHQRPANQLPQNSRTYLFGIKRAAEVARSFAVPEGEQK